MFAHAVKHSNHVVSGHVLWLCYSNSTRIDLYKISSYKIELG